MKLRRSRPFGSLMRRFSRSEVGQAKGIFLQLSFRERVLAVELLELFHVHPMVLRSEPLEKGEDLGIGQVAAAVAHESAAVMVDERDVALGVGINGRAAIRDQLELHWKPFDCRRYAFG